MKELYSVDEILNAIDELQRNKNKKVKIEKNSSFNDKKNEIPLNTLKLIEEAETTINKS